MKDPVLFGKNELERIVSFEVHDNTVSLFVEEENGSVREVIEPNLFWTLTNKPTGHSDKRMGGNLRYKYAQMFDYEQEWRNFNSSVQKQRGYTLMTAWNPKENSQLVKGFTFYKGMKPKDVSVLSWDIETSGLVQNKDSYVYIISNVYRKGDKTIEKLFSYKDYDTQADLLNAWCEWVREINPAILLAYNGNGYDIPYMLHVADLNGVSLDIGRDGSALTTRERPSQFRKDGSQSYTYNKPICYGREVIDQMFVTIRYDIKREFSSYALKTVIRESGLEREGRSFVDAANIKDFLHDSVMWQKALDYALDDARDTLALFDKMIAAQFYSAQVLPRSFQLITESATGSQINGLIIREYLRQFHSIPAPDDVRPFEGGISVAIPGIYKNGIQFDLSNLYPSIIMEYRPYSTYKDPLGVFYKTLQYFKEERLVHKKLYAETGSEYHDGYQQSFKVLSNSYYGFCSAPGLEFNCVEAAAKITGYARQILTKSIKYFTSRDVSDIVKQVEELKCSK